MKKLALLLIFIEFLLIIENMPLAMFVCYNFWYTPAVFKLLTLLFLGKSRARKWQI